MFQGRLRGVLRNLEGRFREGSKASKRSSMGVLREFQGSFKDVLRKFQGSLKKVYFKKSSQNILGVLLKSFYEVLFFNLFIAWISWQKEGLFVI